MDKKLAIAAAAILAAGPALAEDWDFVLTNGSGKPIKTIELAPSGTTNWQKNQSDEIRKDTEVKPGAKTTVRFDKTGCRYDVKATFQDDSSSTWNAIDVCQNAYVTIRYGKDGAPTASGS